MYTMCLVITDMEVAKKIGIDGKFDSLQRSIRKMTLFDYESQNNPKNDKVMLFKVNFFNQVMNTCIITLQESTTVSHLILLTMIYKHSYYSIIELHQKIITFKRCSSNIKRDPRKVLEYICKKKMIELLPSLVTTLKILLILPKTIVIGLTTLSIEKDVSWNVRKRGPVGAIAPLRIFMFVTKLEIFYIKLVLVFSDYWTILVSNKS
ncbi:hypothetical protein AGLY_014690 [Aphis glycines]|uniref:Uncharacterized protein n=1 Tax=Aphis glycines TaxID=307491 RepID=A0A6G0T1W3_APHGL|nr:hypothetical protein AGLY_014690 [Aphis glycines]